MAARDRLTGSFVDFRITPKGEAARSRVPVKVLGVYFVLALICLLPVLSVDGVKATNGFYLLALVNGLFYVAAVVVTVIRHYMENGWIGPRHEAVPHLTLVIALVGLAGFSFAERSTEGAYALGFGLAGVKVAKPLYVVAGAGNGAGLIHYRLDVGWN